MNQTGSTNYGFFSRVTNRMFPAFISICLLLISCATEKAANGQLDPGSNVAPREESASSAAEEKKTDVTGFLSTELMTEKAKAIDKLVNEGIENIYFGTDAFLQANKNNTIPQINTSTDLFMVFSIYVQNGKYNYHFSASQSSYLASTYGKILVGLFCARTGLKAPKNISLSEKLVYHSDWMLSEKEHLNIVKGLNKLQGPYSDTVHAKAMLTGLQIEIE